MGGLRNDECGGEIILRGRSLSVNEGRSVCACSSPSFNYLRKICDGFSRHEDLFLADEVKLGLGKGGRHGFTQNFLDAIDKKPPSFHLEGF